jgi:2-keto-4-pentenoate hydratase
MNLPAGLAPLVDTLAIAWRTHTTADVTLAPVPADPDAAYAVQAALAETLGWFQQTPAPHWKSGGASRDAVLTHAPLPTAGVWRSPADARAWPFTLRYVEAEIALRLGTPVDAARAATLDATSAAACVDAMTVSIEIVDSRWQQALGAPALLRLADLQSHGALVLGAWVPYVARDWAAQACRVQIGGQSGGGQVHGFTGTHSCGDPAWVLASWLRHLTRDGATVPAGTVVTTGTWCGALEAQAGDAVSVHFDGVGEARVQL